MSKKHPIISVTGSSGAGTTTVKHTFQQIFRREGFKAVTIEGDAFHRYDRAEMKKAIAAEEARGNNHLSHFSPEANLLGELENTFRTYSETGTGKTRHYVHDHEEELALGSPAGTFTPWAELDPGSDLLFYEGLHGAVVTDNVNVAQHADLKIGVVPVVNLEWIQKIHRDRATRGYTAEAVTQTILRRMPDYVQLHLPAIHGNRHQLPARADGRYVESVYLTLDPDGGRIHGGHPLQGPARYRLRIFDEHAPRWLHEPGKYHRRPRREGRSGHATHPHAVDYSHHGK